MLLPLRNLARSTPRCFAQLSATRASVQRPASNLLRRSALPQTSCRTSNFAGRGVVAAFHTSRSAFKNEVARADDQGITTELSAKLGQEISLEQGDLTPGQYSQSVQEYIENGPFKVHDTPGVDEVVLSRQFGDETIKVAFTIADYGPNHEADNALLDEEESAQLLEGNDEQQPRSDEEESREETYPVHMSITISRPNKGTLLVDALSQDGETVIESLSHYPTDLVDGKTAENIFKRDALYNGPQFGTLDEDVQRLMERYLEARGINASMALFIPDYIDYKEQREYVRWLNNVKQFVDE